MKITDEILKGAVRAAQSATTDFAIYSQQEAEILAALEAVAPLIARAEAEEIAVMADEAYAAAEAIGLQHPEDSVNRSRMFARAREIEQFARAIRSRHATPTPPQQSPPPAGPQTL